MSPKAVSSLFPTFKENGANLFKHVMEESKLTLLECALPY